MNTNATIRSATANDYNGIAALLTRSNLPVDGVREALPAFMLAESEGEVVGVAGLEICCDNALLRSVAVAEQWRSRGVGRELVTRLVNDAESRGIHALYLLTTTAERYFPGFGFRTIARADVPEDVQKTSEFTGTTCASATVMMRPVAVAAR